MDQKCGRASFVRFVGVRVGDIDLHMEKRNGNRETEMLSLTPHLTPYQEYMNFMVGNASIFCLPFNESSLPSYLTSIRRV